MEGKLNDLKLVSAEIDMAADVHHKDNGHHVTEATLREWARCINASLNTRASQPEAALASKPEGKEMERATTTPHQHKSVFVELEVCSECHGVLSDITAALSSKQEGIKLPDAMRKEMPIPGGVILPKPAAVEAERKDDWRNYKGPDMHDCSSTGGGKETIRRAIELLNAAMVCANNYDKRGLCPQCKDAINKFLTGGD
jgi:hypothetical protein